MISGLGQEIGKRVWNISSYQIAKKLSKFLGSCKKNTGANLKMLPQAKDGINYTSMRMRTVTAFKFIIS